MKIPYSNKTLIWDLIIGLGFLLLGIIMIIENQYNDWIDFLYVLTIPLLYLSMFLYRSFYKYLTIKNGVIKLNSIFGNKININEIIQIKKKKRSLILKSDNKTLTIFTTFLDNKSLTLLELELKKLNVNQV